MDLASATAEVRGSLKDPHPPDPGGVELRVSLEGQRVAEEGPEPPPLDQHQCGPHTNSEASRLANGGGRTQTGMTTSATDEDIRALELDL